MAALAVKQPTKPTQPLLFSSEWDLMYVWTYDWPHRKNPMNLNNSRRRASSSGTSRRRPSSTCNPKPLKCQVYLYQNIKYPTTGSLALITHWGGGLRVRELSCIDVPLVGVATERAEQALDRILTSKKEHVKGICLDQDTLTDVQTGRWTDRQTALLKLMGKLDRSKICILAKFQISWTNFRSFLTPICPQPPKFLRHRSLYENHFTIWWWNRKEE